MRRESIFSVLAVLVVAIGLVTAFRVIGGPGQNRRLALDQRRLRDIQTIAKTLHERYAYEGSEVPSHLPRALSETDPSSGKPYEFARLTAYRYRLCATFALAGESGEGLDPAWHHRSGMQCYRFDVRKEPDGLEAFAAP